MQILLEWVAQKVLSVIYTLCELEHLLRAGFNRQGKKRKHKMSPRKRKEGDIQGQTQAVTKQKGCGHGPRVRLRVPVVVGPKARSRDIRGRGGKSCTKILTKHLSSGDMNNFIFLLCVYTFIFPQL